MAELAVSRLTKHFGETIAVDALDIEVKDREFMTLLGPSGSGKTTVLRMIAGYVEPTAGKVRIGSREVQDMPPEKRDIGMVFQSYALFPHMSVLKNVAFGLERRKLPKPEISQRVEETIRMVRLTGLEQRYPRELSGGQQQRVALARALIIRPTLLLLDEPLSNLDAKLRSELRMEIQRIQKEVGITTLLVTHDQEEALTVSDRVAVIRGGRLEQVADPGELYNHPATRFVAEFVGKMNLIPVTRCELREKSAVYRLPGGETVPAPAGPEHATLAVRPEAIELRKSANAAPMNKLKGRVVQRTFLGEIIEVLAELADGTRLTVRGMNLIAEPGQAVSLGWSPESVTLFESDS